MAEETETSKLSIYPQHEWQIIEHVEAVGYNSKRLSALTPWLTSLDTTAMMVVVGGRVLFEYGDLKHVSYLASARKSILSLLYGKYVEDGTIPLDSTLAEIGFTDIGGLLPQEQQAKVVDLISARSGIYHLASNPGDFPDSAPPRGSISPGSYNLYNNWDFNAAGGVFEALTRRDIYDALETDLARPLGMQDFHRPRQIKNGDATRSKYPAYHMSLSTRDMARIGLLMLRAGKWGDLQIRTSEWIRISTSLVTPLHEINPPEARSLCTGDRWGYGYMWWVWDGPNSPGPYRGAFSAMGIGGQYITVFPELDMVVAHKVDIGKDPTKGIKLIEYGSILRMLIASQRTPIPANSRPS
jgi:CubicO group peptidase (beta-lactamase class C family)